MLSEKEREEYQANFVRKLNHKLHHNIKILIDLDDTIECLIPAWIDKLNSKYCKDFKYENMRDWRLSEAYPDLSEEQILSVLDDEDFWKNIKPREDALKYVKQLYDDGFDLYLCTATNYLNVKPKFDYIIKRYFPYITWDKVIIISKKQMLQADYLIDDHIENLIGGSFEKILIDAPYNQKHPYLEEPECDIIRVDGWEKIYEMISLNG